MSYQVIARKYRPQTFDEVAGQRLVSDTLQNAIRLNRVAHGYIFSGARGVGKTTMARILAKALNCEQGPTPSPCGKCDSCREIAAGNAVDVLEIDAASNRGIDEIRELRESVRYLPARDRNKVFIIDEAHMLTPEAFNALLKTLEEPPERSFFILATTEAHRLPPTIQSRCQHFTFRLLDYAEIVKRLAEICAREGITAEEGALGAIALAAEGSLRDALSLLDEAIAASGERVEESRVRQLLGVVPAKLLSGVIAAIQAGDARAGLELVDQLASGGYDFISFCNELTRMVRNLMVARSCGAASPLIQAPDTERADLDALSQGFTEEDLTRLFQVLLRTQGEMRYSLHPRFHLELAVAKLAHAPNLIALETLLNAVQGTGADPGGPGGGAQVSAARTASGPHTGNPVARPAPTAPKPPSDPQARRQPIQSQQVARPAQGAPQDSTRSAVAPSHMPEPPPLSGSSVPAAAQPDNKAGLDARFAAIQAILFEQSKFLGSCLNPVAGWRFEDGRAEFIYTKDGAWAAELLKGREHQEKLRAACEKVLGQPVRIHVTLGAGGDRSGPARPKAEERARRDPAVENFQKRFDGVLMSVKDLSRG
ncbi:MAG: DNA polymerase III subunit gamma/tau [Terriglobia bacterium]